MGLFGKIFKGVTGAVGGFISGGPAGAIAGGFRGFTGGGRARPGRAFGRSAPAFRPTGPQARRRFEAGGRVRRRGFGIGPGGAFAGETLFEGGVRGGVPATRGTSRLPMLGEIGVTPDVLAIPTRRCPTGQVLALDGLCYPRQMVPKRFRMWPHSRAPVTVGDRNAIRRADRTKKRLVRLTKDAGAHASLSRPRTQRLLPPGGTT